MSGETPTQKVEAFYEKANFFRVIHADGVYGGLTPHGGIHFAFYSERQAIPRHVAFEVQPDGTPGPETTIEAKHGLFREIEADVVMSLPAAAQMHVWLGQHLNVLRKQVGISDSDWNTLMVPK